MQFNKLFIIMSLTLLSTLLFACSSQESNELVSESGDTDTAESSIERQELTTEDSSNVEDIESEVQEEAQVNEDIPEETGSNRKIIYNANLDIEVNNYQNAVNQIEQEITAKNGYIVSSDSYQVEDDLQEGTITARIPQEQFESFIAVVEQGDMKVTQKSISGEDVTEQYVDLESRLKSKEVVEERLLEFMEQAEKTEDLLNISNDLASVQEEIEQITGQLNYLENKSDLATVTLFIRENRLDLVRDEDLNTWERTKEQLMKSINFLLSAGSGLVVFLIGNLPILLLITIIGGVGYYLWKRQKRNKKE
ncbi:MULTISPECIES: DUF4349 domain-containing protein [Paraliobacillus]|uniref:DUF4349 domain-containing protein n=1 Tax=Paraliobacillus TaxID=200903 RepID=UPI001E489300|nr:MULTISPECIES: DUF4349 domain-containing protein [Paraliobacillus]